MVKYFPILKWKTGEAVALEHMNVTEQQMIPVVQIIDEDDPAEFFSSLISHYNHPVYIDTLNNPNEDNACSLLNSFIRYAQENNIPAYPIINYLDTQYISSNVNRCAVYLPIPYDFDGPRPQQIVQNIAQQITGAEIDLFLNAGFINTQQAANNSFQFYMSTLQQIMNSPIITRFVICLTSFPENLSSISSGQSLSCQRLDYNLFNNILIAIEQDNATMKSKLHYSDYGVTKYTDTDIDFRMMRNGILPKIKYTTDNQYIILKGSNNPRISYIDLAYDIVNSQYYFGRAFCFGDEQIYQKSLRTNGTGNNTNWVTYCCNHHLTAVLRQLSRIA